jgi:transposase
MFIKRTVRRYKDREYVNHLLVESVSTPAGPRHNVICSLGDLSPGPPAHWLALAHRIEVGVQGQMSMFPEPAVEEAVARVRRRRKGAPGARRSAAMAKAADVVEVHADQVGVEEAREAGPVHVGHQMWRKLGMDEVLAEAGLDERARQLAEVVALNRFIEPATEHATPDWVRRTALPDILGRSLNTLCDEALYRNLDKLHPKRAAIEKGLAERERSLFNLADDVYLYDLTSTYFEGQCPRNPQAKRGYSRDKRSDCKQVVVGLVVNKEGFSKAHEVFDGNRADRTTVDEMLASLEKRLGKKPGGTVVVDRGMAYRDNIQQIRRRGYHYIVASRQGERVEHLKEFEEETGWEEVIRQPSPRNPSQRKSRVFIKRTMAGPEVRILCRSEGREEKDRAIREKHEARLVVDLTKLEERIANGRLKAPEKIQQAIGRLRERYPRVARYYDISYEPEARQLHWQECPSKKERAARLDGAYVLKTDRTDLTSDDIWRTYTLLTRVEWAFASLKGPLMERPICHQLEHRVQAHIFMCVLAYHLLVATEKMFLDCGVHTSWGTLREQVKTHQVVTVALPLTNGRTLRIRKGTTPEPVHREIYRTLRITDQVMEPVKTISRTIVTENG